MTTYKFEFCVNCYADKALKDVRDVLLENAHSEDVEIVLKPGRPGSYSILKTAKLSFLNQIKGGKLMKKITPAVQAAVDKIGLIL